MEKNPNEVLSSNLVYQSKALHIVRDQVRQPDGKIYHREYVDHPGASLIIPVLPGGKLIMEKQYRHSLGKFFLEFPAGKLDPQEGALAAAKRELREETGYEAQDWTRLGVIHPCIGYSNEFIEIFVARNLDFRGARLDAGEELETFEITREELKEKVTMGEITDAKTLCAYFWFCGKF